MKRQLTTSVVLLVTATIGIVHEAEAGAPAETAKASLANYFKAWHEPDATMRKALLNTAWAENGTYTDPTAHVEGRDALVAHIEQFLSNPQFKGYSIVQASEIDFHHQVFRFEWEMKDPAGNTVTRGMDYGEFDKDGVVTKIVGFFGPFSKLE